MNIKGAWLLWDSISESTLGKDAAIALLKAQHTPQLLYEVSEL